MASLTTPPPAQPPAAVRVPAGCSLNGTNFPTVNPPALSPVRANLRSGGADSSTAAVVADSSASEEPGTTDITSLSLLSLLHASSTMPELLQVHAQLLKSNAIHDTRCLTKLLSFCALSDSGDLRYALHLFSSLPYRNSIMWNTLIHGFCLGPTPEQSILLFVRLIEEDPLLLNSHAFPSVLKACMRIAAFSEGTQIHCCAIKCRAVADPYVQNALIQMYFGCGRSCDGQLMFDRMSERNVVTWNCIIAGYSELGLWENVKSLFRAMIGDSPVVPNPVTLVRVVTACTKSGDLNCGMLVHRYIEESGFQLDLKLGNSLINMYAKSGKMEEAQRLFDQMADHDVVSWTTLVNGYSGIGLLRIARELFDKMPTRNVVAWNAMIAGYVLNGCFEEAILLYKEMQVLGVKIDKATTVSVLSACARLGVLHTGKVIHGYIYKIGIDMTLDLLHSILGLYSKCGNMHSAGLLFKKMVVKNAISWTLMMEGYVKCGAKEVALKIFKQIPCKDVASWNALITALAQCNYFSEALEIFDDMQRLMVSPNSLTLVSILSACARVGALELAQWIHAYIERNNIEMDAHLSSSLIDTYAKCGCIELSLEVFNKMPAKDPTTWSAMIGGLAMHGHSKLALDFFDQMVRCSVRPDAITFIGVLSACSHAGLVEEGKQYFVAMTQTYGISPSDEHYSCMVDLFGRRGLLREAKEFIDGISFSSNGDAIWGALLGACKLHGDVELAEYVATRILEADPTHSGAYVLLSNVYARASKWDSVGRVRGAMKQKGIEKIPGCSSIEVDGVVHEFIVGDGSHPQSREIHMLLDGLAKLLESINGKETIHSNQLD